MADNVTVDNGGLTDYTVSSDEATSGQIQRVKLCYSADAADTHIAADADGLLVNLGANNDVTVTGTVTANLAAGTQNIGDVDVLTVPAPLSTTGGGTEAAALRVTIATDSTGVVSVDDNGATISIDDGGGTITVDGTVGVSGTVTVDSELPSAAALADAAGNPTTPIIGAATLVFNGTTWDRVRGDTTNGIDVDVTRVTGTVTVDTEMATAGALADGAANPTTATVGAALLVFNGTTWDRADSATNALNSTGGGIQAVQLVAQFDDTAPTAITENQFGNLRMSANRNLFATIRDAAGNERGVNVTAGNALSVSIDASTATNISTNIAQMNGVAVTMGNGTSGTGVQRVTIASDSTGTVAVTQATAANLNCTEAATFTDDAAFTIATSKTKAVGGYAAAHGSAPDAADAGDAGVFLMNRHRIQWTIGGHPNLQSVEYNITANATNDNIHAAVAAGTKVVVTQISVINAASTSAAIAVRIGFGTASVPAKGTAGADGVAKVILSHPGIPAGSGIVKGNGSGVVGVGGDDEELRITTTGTWTGELIVQLDYFTIES